MSLLLGRDHVSVRVERWSLLCLELDLRQRFDCEETRWLAVCQQSLLGRLSSEGEDDIISDGG